MIGRVALCVAALGLMALSQDNRLPDVTLSAPQGEYDQHVDSAQGYVALKARVTVLMLGPYGKWSSGISVSLKDSRHTVALKAFSRAEGLPLQVYADRGVDGENAGFAPFRMILDPAYPFDLELRWTSDGQVCMSVKQFDRSESLLFALGALPTKMALGGSSGSFRFEAIEQLVLPAGQDRATADAALKAGCLALS